MTAFHTSDNVANVLQVTRGAGGQYQIGAEWLLANVRGPNDERLPETGGKGRPHEDRTTGSWGKAHQAATALAPKGGKKGKVRVPAVSGGKASDKAGKAAGTSARMAAGTGPAETNGTPEIGAAETGTMATAGAAGQAIS